MRYERLCESRVNYQEIEMNIQPTQREKARELMIFSTKLQRLYSILTIHRTRTCWSVATCRRKHSDSPYFVWVVTWIGKQIQCAERTLPQSPSTHTHLSQNERERTRLWNTISSILMRSVSVKWNTTGAKCSSVLSNYYVLLSVTQYTYYFSTQ